MAIQKTPAIVLRTMPFRSSSLIVTLFSRYFGKIKGIAKGVRLDRETRGAEFELFTLVDIVFYEKTRSDLHLISESAILESYSAVHSSLENIAHASYFADLLDQLSEVHDPHEKIFELLDFCLRYLPSVSGTKLSRLFEVKLLRELGWLPHLESCLHCGNSAVEKGYFSPRQGALLCDACASTYPDVIPLPREALKVLRYFSTHEADLCIRLQMNEATEKELENILGKFLLDRLNKPLKSRLFFDKIKSVL